MARTPAGGCKSTSDWPKEAPCYRGSLLGSTGRHMCYVSCTMRCPQLSWKGGAFAFENRPLCKAGPGLTMHRVVGITSLGIKFHNRLQSRPRFAHVPSSSTWTSVIHYCQQTKRFLAFLSHRQKFHGNVGVTGLGIGFTKKYGHKFRKVSPLTHSATVKSWEGTTRLPSGLFLLRCYTIFMIGSDDFSDHCLILILGVNGIGEQISHPWCRFHVHSITLAC